MILLLNEVYFMTVTADDRISVTSTFLIAWSWFWSWYQKSVVLVLVS